MPALLISLPLAPLLGHVAPQSLELPVFAVWWRVDLQATLVSKELLNASAVGTLRNQVESCFWMGDGVRLATVLDNAVCSPELILQEKPTKEPAFFFSLQLPDVVPFEISKSPPETAYCTLNE
jgi:hypothetical protein